MQTDKVVANIASMPLSDNCCNFLVQIMHPAVVDPCIYTIPMEVVIKSGDMRALLKNQIMDNWMQYIASKDPATAVILHNVDHVELVDCNLLVPKR